MMHTPTASSTVASLQGPPQTWRERRRLYPPAVAVLACIACAAMLFGAGVASAAFLATVTGVSPAQGSASGEAEVTITGSELTAATAVYFGSVQAAGFHVDSSTSITAISPEHAVGKVRITVATPEGSTRATQKATFKFTPAVTGVSPSNGPPAGGTTVTISGVGFALGTSATRIAFGGTQAGSVDCTTTTRCTAVAPGMLRGRDRSTVEVRVKDGGETSPKTSADEFAYRGLYLRDARERLLVGTSVVLRDVIAAGEVSTCYPYIAGEVTANGETTDVPTGGVLEASGCERGAFSGALPGGFTLQIGSAGAGSALGTMDVRGYSGCVYEGSGMSGTVEAQRYLAVHVGASFRWPGNPALPGLEAQLATVEAEIEAVRAQLRALFEEEEPEEAQIEALEDRLETLRARVSALEARIGAIESECSSSDRVGMTIEDEQLSLEQVG
jgi:hypothetical protein